MRSLLRTSLIVACAAASFGTTAKAENYMESKAVFGYMVDYNTGTVLFEKRADEQMGPSSMTKLMTAYMIFEALDDGSLTLEEKVPVSKTAWKKGGSKMFVKEGTFVKVDDLLKGIIVQSGNDACIVMAERLASSEASFAEEMTFKGREIGLTGSHFLNATGWPDKGHLMTAKDLVTLAVRIYEDYPQHMHYYSTPEFTYNGINQKNRNKLIHRNIGVDGFKTGYTSANGYGIVVTAEQDGRRVFLAVNGLTSVKDRLNEAERLVRHAFRDFKNVELFKKGEVVESAKVWLGTDGEVPLIAADDLEFTMLTKKSQQAEYEIRVEYEGPISAPIKMGDHIANLVVMRDGDDFQKMPLHAGTNVDRVNFFQSLVPKAKYYLLNEY